MIKLWSMFCSESVNRSVDQLFSVRIVMYGYINYVKLLGRLPNFGSDLILWVANFRPSVRPQKVCFNFDEIWYTGSTR